MTSVCFSREDIIIFNLLCEKYRTTFILRLNDSIDEVGVDVQRLYHARRENLQQRSTDVNKNSFTNDNLCDTGSDQAGNMLEIWKYVLLYEKQRGRLGENDDMELLGQNGQYSGVWGGISYWAYTKP